MNVTTVYLIFLGAGLIYSLFVGLAGDLVGGDADIDADFDADGAGDLHFSLFSPTVLAAFAAAFGATGIITKEAFHLSVAMQVTIATGVGLSVGVFMGYVIAKLKQMSKTSGEVALVADLVGSEAVVTVEISPEGSGEIAYEAKGSRFTAPAQSEGKERIEKSTIVKITRGVGTTFFVERQKAEV